MIAFPNIKINLGLSITEKRPDGYHNLETVFYPVPVEDALEVNILNESTQKFRLHQAGLEIAGEAENNLVVKAYKLLDERFNLPPIDIHLFKHIPSGAGLGGGSSDAAYMLKLLNEKFNLELSDENLEEYAAKLGADCAFFIRNAPFGKSYRRRSCAAFRTANNPTDPTAAGFCGSPPACCPAWHAAAAVARPRRDRPPTKAAYSGVLLRR